MNVGPFYDILPPGAARWRVPHSPGRIPCKDGFGLLDYNARYYDAGLGRFISPDTMVPEPGNPQSLNRYSYVLNRPVRYTDPSGHWGGDGMGLAMPMDTYEGVMGGGGGGGGLVIALAVSTIIIAQNAPEISEAMSDVLIPPYVPADQEGFTLQEAPNPLSPGPTLNMPAWDPVYSYPLGANGDQTIGLDFPLERPSVLGDNVLQSSYRGGIYEDIPGRPGIERHHMPADSVSALLKNKGFVIEMDTPDHRATASWGNSRGAQAYRALQKQLIRQGRLDDAIQMDIDDVQSKFGSKYDKAILEMIDQLPR